LQVRKEGRGLESLTGMEIDMRGTESKEGRKKNGGQKEVRKKEGYTRASKVLYPFILLVPAHANGNKNISNTAQINPIYHSVIHGAV
jgi:hypothetical protein